MNEISTIKKIKKFVKDRKPLQYSLYVVLTATMLYIAYFIIKNFDSVLIYAGKGFSALMSALWPLIIGLIIAYIITPLVDMINRRLNNGTLDPFSDDVKDIKRFKRKRLASVLIAYIIIITAIIALLYAFVALALKTIISESLPQLIDNLAQYASTYEQTIKDWVNNIPGDVLSEKLQTVTDKVLKWITNSFSTQSIISTVSGLGGSVMNFFIGIIASIYIVYDKKFFKDMWNTGLNLICKETTASRINRGLRSVDGVLSAFFKGIFIDAIIVAILSSVGLTILGLKFAVFLGIFAGFCNVIPYFGPILGMIPAFLIGIFTQDFAHGIIAILILFAVQQIDANLIYPRVVGGSTGLHPLFVLLAVTVGGYFGGLVGMILAVPIAGVVKLIAVRFVRKREYMLLLRKEEEKKKAQRKRYN